MKSKLDVVYENCTPDENWLGKLVQPQLPMKVKKSIIVIKGSKSCISLKILQWSSVLPLDRLIAVARFRVRNQVKG